MNKDIKAGIYGLAVGDALGTPVEYCSREELIKKPVVGMEGFGTYDVDAGTWSDNTGLSLCLMDSLARSYARCEEEGKTDNRSLAGAIDYDEIMKNICRWADDGVFTATGEAFDIGHATQKAILMRKSGKEPIECGGTDERANGNGSLTRILPLLYYFSPISDDELDAVMDAVHNVSSLTHAHPISKVACGMFVMMGNALLTGGRIENGVAQALKYYEHHSEFGSYIPRFDRLLDIPKFKAREEKKIRCGTYVVDTLEASLWCYLNTYNYKDCVLKAVNLGDDADCVGAVAGAFAGMKYGFDDIPAEWIDALAGKEQIDSLIADFTK